MNLFWQGLPWLKAFTTPAKQEVKNDEVPCTLEGLKSLLDLVQEFAVADSDGWIEFVQDMLVEKLRRLSELIVWGETHDPRFLDLFCQRRILADFVSFLGSASMPVQVKVQVLQTLSIIVPNVKSGESLRCLLHGNLINEVIMVSLDFSDEEILTWYISFLKSLALRLDDSTARYFFDSETSSFPLYTQAARFFSHHDLLVQASVRYLTLKIFSLEDDDVQTFLATQVAPSFFQLVATSIRDAWERVDVITKANHSAGFCILTAISDPASSAAIEGLRDALQEETELLEYVKDVYEAVSFQYAKDVLAKFVLCSAFLPLVGCLHDPRVCPAVSSADSKRNSWPSRTLSSPELGNSDVTGRPFRAMSDPGIPDVRGHVGDSTLGRLDVSPAVALYALTGVLRIFGAYEQIIEPVGRTLLWPSLTSDFRDAILVSGQSIDAMEAALNTWSGVLAAEESSFPTSIWMQKPPMMLVTNPFRSTIVSLLAVDETAAEVAKRFSSAEAPLAVKTLIYQLEVSPALPASVLEQCPHQIKARFRAMRTPIHNVVLEVVHADGVLLDTVRPEYRAIILRAQGEVFHALVGRQHQPEIFQHLVFDKRRLMSISRTHFELSWASPSEPIMLRKISANALYLDDQLVEMGVVVRVAEGATLRFQGYADTTIFLTLRLRFNSQGRMPPPSQMFQAPDESIQQAEGQKPRPKKRSQSGPLSPQAGVPRPIPAAPTSGSAPLMILECTFTMGIELARIPVQARNLGVDVRHRTVIGRQHQPGFFENLLQGAPNFVQYISRAHFEVMGAGHPYDLIKITNLSFNTIFVDSQPVAKGDACPVHAGSTLAFVAAASGEVKGSSSREAKIIHFLQFVLRRPASKGSATPSTVLSTSL